MHERRVGILLYVSKSSPNCELELTGFETLYFNPSEFKEDMQVTAYLFSQFL